MPAGRVRLFCDEMLRRLGRWLRAAGYDTAIAERGLADADIIARCIAEARTLIHPRSSLEGHERGRVPVIRLAEHRVDEQSRALPACSASTGKTPRSPAVLWTTRRSIKGVLSVSFTRAGRLKQCWS